MKVLVLVATAYVLHCGGSGRTYTGNRTHWGIAVSRYSHIPLGTRMIVPGYGRAVVDDYLGPQAGPNRIDLRHPSHRWCVKWGRKTVRVKLIFPKRVKGRRRR